MLLRRQTGGMAQKSSAKPDEKERQLLCAFDTEEEGKEREIISTIRLFLFPRP